MAAIKRIEDCKNTNDIVYLIAARAKALAAYDIQMLRRAVASQEATTEHAMWKESAHKTKGDMIEEILEEEFIVEFPNDIEQPEREDRSGVSS